MYSKYIAGLNWRQFDQDKKSTHRSANKPHFYALSKNSQDQYGFSDSIENHKKVSLAALLSYKYDNLFFITNKQGLGNPTDLPYWLCVIENGKIINSATLLSDSKLNKLVNKKYRVNEVDINYSGDQFCNTTEFTTIAHYLIAKAKSNSQPLLLHTDLAEEDILSSIQEEKISIHHINLDEEVASLRKYENKAKVINHAAKKKQKVILSILAAIGLIMGLHFVLNTSSKDTSTEKLQMQQRLKFWQEKELKQQKITYQHWLEESSAYTAMLTMKCALDKVPKLVNGWLLNEYSYQLNQNKDHNNFILDLIYHRLPYGQLDSLLNFKFDSLTMLKTEVQEHENVVEVFLQSQLTPCHSEVKTEPKEQEKNIKQNIISFVSNLQRRNLNYHVSKKLEDKTFNKSYYEIDVSGTDYTQLMSYMNLIQKYHQLILNDFSAIEQLGELGDWNAKTMLYI